MHTFETAHGLPRERKSGKVFSVALVGSLHIAAIYTLLVALDIVPNPIIPKPTILIIHVIHQVQPTHTLPPVAPTRVVLTRPPENPVPREPIFDLAPGKTSIAPLPPQPVPQPGPIAPPHPGPTLPLQALSETHTIPTYPMLDIRMGHEGTAHLRLTVDAQGNVVSAEILQSSGYEGLDAAAIAWVKSHWRYRPAVKDGQPVGATTNAVVVFRLNGARG